MLYLFTIFVSGFGREEFELEDWPTFDHLILGWLAFLGSGLAGIFVGFFDAWFMEVGVIVAPAIASVRRQII